MAEPGLEHYLGDAYAPREIARKVESMGVAKAHTDTPTILILAVLAGAFISLGSMFFTVIVTGSELGFGITRLLGGIGFCLGLILVVVAGAELFTGNNLLAMAWASGRLGLRDVARNWLLSYAGNVAGCLGTVMLIWLGGIAALDDGAVGTTALRIASAKAELSLLEVFCRGVLCNALVCMAVWLTLGGHSVTDKVLAILFPIAAFVTIGFEHCIANWFFLPYALLLDANAAVPLAGVLRNLLASTLGNLVGGTVLVAGVYWLAYLREQRAARA